MGSLVSALPTSGFEGMKPTLREVQLVVDRLELKSRFSDFQSSALGIPMGARVLSNF